MRFTLTLKLDEHGRRRGENSLQVRTSLPSLKSHLDRMQDCCALSECHRLDRCGFLSFSSHPVHQSPSILLLFILTTSPLPPTHLEYPLNASYLKLASQ